MKELVEYIAKSLVDDEDAVRVELIERHRLVKIRLRVAPRDTGRVIGKRGRVANAMRTLLNVLGTRKGVRVELEIT
jgi:hypothetical protein